MKKIEKILENQEEYSNSASGSYYSVLYNIASNIDVDGFVVEIGTDLGESAIALASGLRDGGIDKKVITVDIGIIQEIRGDKLSESLRRAWVNEKIISHDLMTDIITIGCSSEEFSKFFDSPISLLFVDGSHDVELAMFDIKYYGDLISSGGIIVCDDYYPKDSLNRDGLSDILDEFFANSNDYIDITVSGDNNRLLMAQKI